MLSSFNFEWVNERMSDFDRNLWEMSLKIKQSLEKEIGSSTNQRMNKKVDMLHQTLILAKWIAEFDPDSINDVF